MIAIHRRGALVGAAGLLGGALSPEILQARVAAETAAAWGVAFADLEGDVPQRPMRRVQGRAPAGLNGVLLRNGGAKFRRPKGAAAHWFDGDGLIRRFTVRDGAASFDARFVDTPKRRADASADAVVSMGFGTPRGGDAALSSPDDVNAANISVIRRGDALWALWEAGSPVALDPTTLETRGIVTLRPDLAHAPFLAHPRFESDGTLWNLGQAGAKAVVWKVDPEGGLVAATPIALPRASYIHDFTMTRTRLVVVLQPWIFEGAGPLTSALSWRPSLGAEVLVLDKDDLTRTRRYALPPFFHFHMGAAHEDASGAIRFEICQAPDPAFAVKGAVDVLKGVYRPEPPPTLAMVTLGPGSSARLETAHVAAEFPRSDARFSGAARRFTLHACAASNDRPLFRGVGLYDWTKGRSAAFDLGSDHIAEEMVFTPRPGSTDEMDGFIIGPAVNLKEKATELFVFDARRIEDGPLVTWRADVAAPVGLHGAFTPA